MAVPWKIATIAMDYHRLLHLTPAVKTSNGLLASPEADSWTGILRPECLLRRGELGDAEIRRSVGDQRQHDRLSGVFHSRRVTGPAVLRTISRLDTSRSVTGQ
jgi:hypothetical protein